MIHGIGVDVLHLPRLAALLSKPYSSRLARRILTSNELKSYNLVPSHQRLQFLATRWTLKEASWKAVQPFPTSWKDAEIVTLPNGAPEVRTPGFKLLASLSHDGDYCTAFVVAYKTSMDKRGTGEMVGDHTKDYPRHKDSADDWLEKW